MRGVTWALCLWPGLPRLWRRGDWPGMVLAIGFTVMLNFALLASFAWTEAVAPSVRGWTWGLVGGWWLVSALVSWRFLDSGEAAARGAPQDLFPAAQAEYLKGNWVEAEALCQRLLRDDRHDVDSHLLVASICRRTDRLDEARQRLDLVSSLEASYKWNWEIGRERELLRRVAADADEPADSPENAARKAA